MKHIWKLFVALALSHCCVAAPIGTISGMEIETNGCVVRVWGEGMAANLIGFQNGFNRTETIVGGFTNWSFAPSTSTNGLIITATVPGFTTNGTATTYTWTNYGTKLSRLSYPLQVSNDVVVVNTTNWMARVFLSDYIFAEDTSILGYVSAGGFATTNAVTNCLSASAIVVTNSSTQTYHGTRAIANWTWPGWNFVTNTTMTLKMVGFNSSARSGAPLACVWFITKDETGNTITNVVSAMSKDGTNFSSLSFGEYAASISTAGFVNKEQLRTDFIAFPWRGTTNACMDTRLDNHAGITRMPTSQTNYLVRIATYTNLIAAVQPTFGSDSNGRVTNGVDSSIIATNHYFASIKGAAHALAGTNWNINQIVGVAGTTIFLSTNTDRFIGTSISASNTPKAYVTITPLPGHSVTLRSQNAAVDDQDISDRIRFVGVSTAISNTAIPLRNIEFLWFDQSPSLVSTSSSCIFADASPMLVWVTRSTVGRFAQGLQARNASDNASFMVRDCVLDGFAATTTEQLKVSTVAGVRTTGATTNYTIIFEVASQGTPLGYEILYNSIFYNSQRNTTMLDVYGSSACRLGAALVQNIFEKTGAHNQPIAAVASSSTSAHSTNIIVWHNDFTGERVADWFSNSNSESTNKWRIHHQMRNNVIDLSGFKKDYETGGEDADRIGNWSILHQVNSSGNVFVECLVNSAAGGFPPDYQGLHSSYPYPFSNKTNLTSYPSYVNRQSSIAHAVAGNGNGDYHINPNGPPIGRAVDWVLPYDIGGRARQASGAAGAWEFIPYKARIFGKTIIRNGP